MVTPTTSSAPCIATTPATAESLARPDLVRATRELGLAADIEKLAPELLPSPPDVLRVAHREGLEFRALGRRERTHWGVMTVLRGVEAIVDDETEPT